MTDTGSSEGWGSILADHLGAAVDAAPELGNSPGNAVAVAQQGGDVAGNAQAVAHTGNQIATQNAYNSVAQQVGGHSTLHQVFGFLSRGWHDLTSNPITGAVIHNLAPTTAFLAVGNMANKPLQTVHHEYRYLHDVEARHGRLAGLVESLGLAAGAALGGYVAGAQGAVLGAEAAGWVEGKTYHTDSWQRTADPKYRDPNNGQVVNWGQDIAKLVTSVPGLHSGHIYTAAADVGGFLGDLALDPLVQVGGLAGAARQAAGAPGLLGRAFSGTGARTVEDVDRIFGQYRSVRNAFADIAEKNPGQIVATYPQLANDNYLLSRLGEASNVGEVKDVFREAVRAQELTLTDMSRLPTLTFTRDLARQAGLGLQEANIPGVSRLAQRMNRVPQAFDPESLSFSRAEFSPMDDYGAHGIRQMLLMGEKPSVADSVTAAYLNAKTPAARIAIYRNAVVDTLGVMADRYGIGGDAKAIGEYADSLIKNALPAADEGVYAVSSEGRNISNIVDHATGKGMAAAVTDNQIGKLAYPNFVAMKRAAKEVSNTRDWLGTVDDFAYNHVTQGVFKKLILLSLGYPIRIALAEDIPNALRLGVTDMVQDRLASSMGKLGYQVDKREAGAIGRYVWNMLGPAGMQDADRVEFAVKLAHANEGGIVTDGVSSEHNLHGIVSDPVVEKVSRSLRSAVVRTPTKEVTTGDFGLFAGADKRTPEHWRAWLREVADDPKTSVAASAYLEAMKGGASETEATTKAVEAAKDWLDGQPDKYLNQYLRHFYNSAGDEAVNNHEDWARVAVENMKGATTGADGTIHVPLLDAVSRGDAPTVDALAGIDEISRPAMVKGRQTLPNPEGTIDRIANFGFRRVLNPVVNFLAREPTYLEEAYRQWQWLKPLVEQGVMTEDEALTKTQVAATSKMIKFVHNLNERTQFAETMRNWSPFYFAQEQAYKRAGRLLAEDPGAFRKYQMILSGFHDIGTAHKDAQGADYVVFPGAGWMGSGVPTILDKLGIPLIGSAPVTFTGNLSSMATVLPFGELPRFGPVVAVPAKAIANMFPELQRPVAALMGPEAAAPIWKMLVPNGTVQRTIEAFQGNSRAFHSSMMQVQQMMDYRQQTALREWRALPEVQSAGTANPMASESELAQMSGKPLPDIVPPPGAGPIVQQDFVNRVRNQTRILYIMRAMLGALSPLSPNVKPEDWGLPQELRAEVAKAGSLNVGTHNFLLNNPDATAFTTYQSTSNTGATLPATAEAENWIDGHLELIHRYPYAAAWLLPPVDSTKYDPGVYNQQLAEGLRGKKAPEQFQKDLYVAATNHQFYDIDRPAYYGALLRAAHPDWSETEVRSHAEKGLTNQDWTDIRGSVDVQPIQQAWSQYRQMLMKQNPVWADWVGSADRTVRRAQAVEQMKTMFRTGDVPAGPQTDDLRGLLADYEKYEQAHAVGRQDSWASFTSGQLRDAWQLYVEQLAKDKPNLAGVIQSVFMEAQPQ